MNLAANEIHFVIGCLCQKGGETLAIFMYHWMNSGHIHEVWVNLWTGFMYCYASIYALLVIIDFRISADSQP